LPVGRARRNRVAYRFVQSDERAIDLENRMPRGDKSKYTEKQKRQAEHIEEGYEKRGVSEPEAERRAWATVNKMTGGGKESGSGRGEPVNKAPARKGGRLGGAAAAARPKSARSAAARKAAQTRSPSQARKPLSRVWGC
jgi:plasmid stabilization system protein ParE